LIDKPTGISSYDVIRRLNKVAGKQKMGHIGTLDPFASGLLPICIGKATKAIPYLKTDPKTYLVKMKFGLRTNTGDITGETTQEDERVIQMSDLENCLPKINSMTVQDTPRFSAKKIGGKRAYELARKNIDFQPPKQQIRIYEFEPIEMAYPYCTYLCVVSKGTYIRTLSEDIAAMLDTVATTTELRRLSVGNINVDNAVKLDDITSSNWQQHLLSIPKVCPHLHTITLSEPDVKKFLHGRNIRCSENHIGNIIVTDEKGTCVGIAKVEDNTIYPKKALQ